MRNDEIIRAWKDAEYRRGLSREELARLPQHPAGVLELTDEELSSVQGGVWTVVVRASFKFCKGIGQASLRSCPLVTQQFICKLF
ncbi:MAG TPA: mersacidin/lichenicidin family type 2 lantibiotic [Pyrinomonadaceae bacterium]|nr:mersacidin/lichenicidin family type 2 lantibiotic [Pyrinomonadaceae bacterium]